MSQPAPNTSLSQSARLLYYLGPPSTILLTSVASPQTGLLSPLTFLPTAWFYRKWQRSNELDSSRRGELEPMVWIYAATGTLGLTTVALVQLAIVKVANSLLFRSSEMRKDFWTEFQRSTVAGLTAAELSRRTELATSWQNWVFNGALSFVAAGLCEETLKYLPIAYARRRGTPKERQPRNRAYIDYALAGALSFGLIETIGFLYGSCEHGHETGLKLLFTILERVVAGQLAHLSVATLTALRAIRRDYYGDQLSWWSIVGPAAFLHGAFDFVAFSASALEGNVGWIHPSGVKTTVTMLGLCSSLVATAVWKAKQEWKGLDDRDRIKTSAQDDSTHK